MRIYQKTKKDIIKIIEDNHIKNNDIKKEGKISSYYFGKSEIL